MADVPDLAECRLDPLQAGPAGRKLVAIGNPIPLVCPLGVDRIGQGDLLFGVG